MALQFWKREYIGEDLNFFLQGEGFWMAVVLQGSRGVCDVKYKHFFSLKGVGV